MAHLDVVKAVEERLRLNFSECPVYMENAVTDTPDEAGAWLSLNFPYIGSEQATIGSPGLNRYHEEGSFRILLSIPRGEGTHKGRQWLDTIATLFRGVRFAGIRCYAPTSAVTDDRNETSTYYRLSISIPYDFSILG